MELCGKKVKVSVFDASVFENEKEFHKAYSNMSEARRKKVDSLNMKKDKNLSLAAGVLLEEELKKLGIESRLLLQDEKGKPYIPGADIHFNLSHSGSLAACAISDGEVGIDIQKISEIKESLMKKVTTEREYEVLKRLDENARLDVFFRIWTMKESYLKYTGEGLGVSPKRLEVSFGEATRLKRDGEEMNVIFEEYDVKGYRLTVCYSSFS